MQNNISFKYSGLSGDVIHYMAGIKAVCERQDCKADIYLWLNQHMKSYDGAVHPYGDVMITDYAFEMLRPLLEAQEYVSSVQAWKGETIMVDMDRMRQTQVGMPYGSLSSWVGLCFPDMQADLSQPWLGGGKCATWDEEVTKETNPAWEYGETVLVNRTQRYRNPYVSYFFLKDYKNIMFTGMPEEHAEFCKDFELDIPLLKVRDFLELSDYICNCRLFIGNQSMCFAIAEGLKIPRLLEMCPAAPNVHPVGADAHYFFFQEGLTFWVQELNKSEE